MAARFNASYKGIGEMLCAPWMIEEMRKRAERAKTFAEGIAPVETGEYKESFEIESGIREGKTRRAFARLSNTSDHAFYVEYGTSDTPKNRVLGRSLDMLK